MSPENITISNRGLLRLHQGLNSLDAVKSGTDGFIPNEFDNSTKVKIVTNAVATENARVVYDKLEQASMKEFKVSNGMPNTPENIAALARFEEAKAVFLDASVTIGVAKIKISSLLNRPRPDPKEPQKFNPVPPTVLAQLDPVLEYDVE